jgi:hypothetical protein
LPVLSGRKSSSASSHNPAVSASCRVSCAIYTHCPRKPAVPIWFANIKLDGKKHTSLRMVGGTSVTREGYEYLYKMFSIRRSILSPQRSSDPLRHFSHQSHSFAMLDPIQKTTITRFVHILAVVDRSDWEHNSDELATIDPMAIVQFAPSTATQRASDYTTSEADSTPEYPCDLGLGSLRPIAPKEVPANRWSTASRLVFPMGPLAMPNRDEEREVKVPHRRRAIADDVFLL